MKTLQDLKVGDKVWYSDVNRRGLEGGAVSKVGRKLITVGHHVFRKDTGRTNDEYGHQRLIPDLVAYEERKKALACFRQIVGYHSLPDGVSLADVKAAAALLRISLEDEE